MRRLSVYAAVVTDVPMAHPRVAAGALFLDQGGRVLLVHPTYKNYWDIPGGYVEPGESPFQACKREVHEELAITPTIGGLLVVDWAPAEDEGDKLLFVFDGGVLSPETIPRASPAEIDGWDFVDVTKVADRVPERLSRRIDAALSARRRGSAAYLEHGGAIA